MGGRDPQLVGQVSVFLRGNTAAHSSNSQVVRGTGTEAAASRDNEAPSTMDLLDMERRQWMAPG